MDVHHQPKPERKHLREYLREFLMIFLAVTLGFFAESYREHLLACRREVYYMNGIVQDMKDDTSELNDELAFERMLQLHMDSALRIPVQRLQHTGAQDTFYHHFVYFYSWCPTFFQHDNMLAQLRNAGGFSVIQQKDVVDSISALSLYFKQLVDYNGSFYQQYYYRVNDAAAKIIKCPVFAGSFHDPVLNIPVDSAILVTYNEQQLQELFNNIRMESSQLLQCIDVEEQYERKVISLIHFISVKYHFEEKG